MARGGFTMEEMYADQGRPDGAVAMTRPKRTGFTMDEMYGRRSPLPPRPEPEPWPESSLGEPVMTAEGELVGPSGSERGDYIASSVARGVANAPSAILKGGTALAVALGNARWGGRAQVKGHPVYQLGEQAQSYVESAIPRDSRMAGEFWSETVPEGFGTMLTFVATGGAGAAARAPAWLAPMLMGAAMEAGSQYDQAVAAGANDADAQFAAVLGGLVGTSEAVPVGHLFHRLNKASGGEFSRRLSAVVRRAAVQGVTQSFEEAIQETFQGTAGNAVAKLIYDSDRGIFEGVGEQGAAGGVIGFVTGTALAAATGARPRRGVTGAPPPARPAPGDGRQGGASVGTVPPARIPPPATPPPVVTEPPTPPQTPSPVAPPPEGETAAVSPETQARRRLLTAEGAAAWASENPEAARRIVESFKPAQPGEPGKPGQPATVDPATIRAAGLQEILTRPRNWAQFAQRLQAAIGPPAQAAPTAGQEVQGAQETGASTEAVGVPEGTQGSQEGRLRVRGDAQGGLEAQAGTVAEQPWEVTLDDYVEKKNIEAIQGADAAIDYALRNVPETTFASPKKKLYELLKLPPPGSDYLLRLGLLWSWKQDSGRGPAPTHENMVRDLSLEIFKAKAESEGLDPGGLLGPMSGLTDAEKRARVEESEKIARRVISSVVSKTKSMEAESSAVEAHRSSVEKARREGKKIPAEVLADYPDMERAPGAPFAVGDAVAWLAADGSRRRATVLELKPDGTAIIQTARGAKRTKRIDELTKIVPRAKRAPRQATGLAEAEKQVQALADKYRDLVGTIDELYGQETAEDPSRGLYRPAYSFRPGNESLVQEIRDRLPRHLQMNVVISTENRYADGADVHAEIGTDAMAQAVINHASQGKGATLERTASFIEQHPEQFDALERYQVAQWRARSQGGEAAADAKKQTPVVVPVDSLAVGAKMTVAGEPHTVTAIDPDTGDVVLENGITQSLPAGQQIAIDQGSLKQPTESMAFGEEQAAPPAPRPAPVPPGPVGIFGQPTYDSATGQQQQMEFTTDLQGNTLTPQGWMTPEGKLRPDINAAAEQKMAAELADSGQMTIGQAAQPTGKGGGGGATAGYRATAGKNAGPQPEIDTSPLPASGAIVRRIMELRPVPAPELYQLAKQIMGKPPVLKRLVSNLGLFYSRGKGEIAINRITAGDEKLMAHVLAHEIGHLTDYIPDQTLGRGNILGRIASLRKYLVHTLPAEPGGAEVLSKKDRKQLRKDAKARAGRGAKSDVVSEIYRELVEEEVAARGLLSNKDVRDELIALSQWWSNWDDTLSGSERRYRESSRELYAEALSVMLSAPSELKARAPLFDAAVKEYMDRKPEFLQAYVEVQSLMEGGPEAVAERRSQTLRQMLQNADAVVTATEQARKAADLSPIETIRQFFEQFLLDRRYPALQLARKAQRGQFVEDAKNAEFIIDELNLQDNPNHVMLDRLDRNVWAPLREAGVDRADILEYMFARRIVAGDRAEIGNPLAFTPSAAGEQYAALEKRLGPEKWRALNERMAYFHQQIALPIAERAVASGVYSKENFQNIILPNLGNYAAFVVLKYYDGHVPAGIKHQVGTFEEILHPLEGTIQKFIALNRLIELNNAKVAIRDAMQSLGQLQEVPVPYGEWKPTKRPPPGMDYLSVMEDGKWKAYLAPTNVVDATMSHDVGGIVRHAKVMRSAVYRVFHTVFVKYNPGFLAFNQFRDVRRTYRSMHAIGGRLYRQEIARLTQQGVPLAEARNHARSRKITLGQVLAAYWQSVSASKRRAAGVHDTLIEQMTEEKALGVPFVDVTSELGDEAWMDRELKRRGLHPTPQAKRNAVLEAGRKVLTALEYVGTLQETTSKVAGYKLLEQRGVPTKERAYYVRKYAGTPDIYQAGLATPITNSLWLYSKVKLNGLQADMQLATGKDTAASWWWSQVATGVLPTMAKWLALMGVGGALLKEWFGKIGEYYLKNYDIVPVGMVGDDDEWKPAFLTIPADETTRMLNTVLWNIMQQMRMDPTVKPETFSDLWGDLVPKFNPAIDIGAKWLAFANGENPYDSHFGNKLVPETEWTAGGWAATKRMLLWTRNQFGSVSLLARVFTERFGNAQEVSPRSPTEIVVSSIPGVSSLLRISDRGTSEREWAALDVEDQENARFRLSLPDNARDVTRERYLLNRLGEEQLGEDKQLRRAELNGWYNETYLPLTSQIKEATDRGMAGEADRLRQELETRTRELGSETSQAAARDAMVADRVQAIRRERPRLRSKIPEWTENRKAARQWLADQGISDRDAVAAYNRDRARAKRRQLERERQTPPASPSPGGRR